MIKFMEFSHKAADQVGGAPSPPISPPLRKANKTTRQVNRPPVDSPHTGIFDRRSVKRIRIFQTRPGSFGQKIEEVGRRDREWSTVHARWSVGTSFSVFTCAKWCRWRRVRQIEITVGLGMPKSTQKYININKYIMPEKDCLKITGQRDIEF